MPNVQFSVPSSLYLALGRLAEASDLSTEQYAKYLLWYALQAGVTADEVQEAKRDFDRKNKGGIKH